MASTYHTFPLDLGHTSVAASAYKALVLEVRKHLETDLSIFQGEMFKDESYLPAQGSLEVILTIMAKIPTTSPSGQRIHQLIRTCRRTIGPDEFRGCETQNQLLNLLYREKSGRSEEVRKKQDDAIQARLLLINEWHEQKCVREMLKDYDDLLEELIERNEGDMFELRGRIRDVKSYLSEQDEKFAALDENKKGEEAKKTVLEEFDDLAL